MTKAQPISNNYQELGIWSFPGVVLPPVSISADRYHPWCLVEKPQIHMMLPYSFCHTWHSIHCDSHSLYFYQTKIAHNDL